MRGILIVMFLASTIPMTAIAQEDIPGSGPDLLYDDDYQHWKLDVPRFSRIPLAKREQKNGQSTILAKMGIVRMESKQTIFADSQEESERVIFVETYFDSLGRILWSQNDVCNDCGTVQQFDSFSGLVTYYRFAWRNGFRESFFEYDTLKRRTTITTCVNGEDDDCVFYSFEYDDDNTERIYKALHRRLLKHDKIKKSRRLYRIYAPSEQKIQLVQESFFSPEGQLEETRKYYNENFYYSFLYDYDEKGQLTRLWDFNGKTKSVSYEFGRNASGQLITWKMFYFSPGDPLHIFGVPTIHTFEYGENGLLIKMSTKRATWEYTYFKD